MNEKKNIVSFINHVTNNEFKRADAALAAVVNEKIKQRIADANRALAKGGK
jgi:hypothetical protein